MEAGASIPPRARILVADDEPHIRRVLTAVLRNGGFCVREAQDGGEALDVLDSGEPLDLFILDLMMPRASGMEVLARIRSHPVYGHAPVIILTAKGQDTDREAAFLAGADDFITKPFSPKRLLSRIQEVLAAR